MKIALSNNKSVIVKPCILRYDARLHTLLGFCEYYSKNQALGRLGLDLNIHEAGCVEVPVYMVSEELTDMLSKTVGLLPIDSFVDCYSVELAINKYSKAYQFNFLFAYHVATRHDEADRFIPTAKRLAGECFHVCASYRYARAVIL